VCARNHGRARRILLTRFFARSYHLPARYKAGVDRGLRSDKRRNAQGGDMSFWENASSATKGIIVVGAILIAALGGMFVTKTGIYSEAVEGTTQQRGLTPPE
jgi:hypothetical protein